MKAESVELRVSAPSFRDCAPRLLEALQCIVPEAIR